MSEYEAAWRALVAGETRAPWAPAARLGMGILAGLYSAGVAAYRAGFDLGILPAERLPCRVVSVGNLTVGGTGKTTTVRWLVRRLQAWGLHPAVLSYGYRARAGAAAEAPLVVAGPEGVRVPVEVSGDEPQLLARSLPGVPVLAGRRRARSGRLACEQFDVDTCVLDDGYQYWKVEKDLEIVLIDATNPFGYGRVLPAGMLRESPRALRRADAALITHADAVPDARRKELRGRLLKLNGGLALAEARHAAVELRSHPKGERLPLEGLREGRWLAMSSLGAPEAFERTLAEMGARNPLVMRFPDHHPYTAEELEAVKRRVRDAELSGIVTTEKDAVKLAPEWLEGVPCRVAAVDLQFMKGQDEFEALLRSRLQ